MPRSRGLTIYVGLHVAAAVATLVAAVVVLLSRAGFPANVASNFAATAVAYLQAQFFAAWVVLGSSRPGVRFFGGLLGALAILAPPLVYGILETGRVWFPLKLVAGAIVLPAAVVIVGLSPELLGGRRIRFTPRDARLAGAPPQFSLRALFVATVLSSALVFAARFFPLQISSVGESPWMERYNAGLGQPAVDYAQVSYGAFILAPPAAVVVAACLLLWPGRIWWMTPAPVVVGFLAGAAVSAMEERAFTTQSLLGGVVCAVICLVPVAHFLILRACGYRITWEEQLRRPKSPSSA